MSHIFCMCGSSGWASVKVWPGKPVITSRQVGVFVLNRMAFCIRDHRKIRRTEPPSSQLLSGLRK